MRTALGAVWTARNPREPFTRSPAPSRVDRLYYRAADGWESPVWRLPRSREGRGEPVLLLSGLGLGRLALDFDAETSLARSLQAAGYDVYLGGHRGGEGTVAPPGAGACDFDDIVTYDLPALIEKVCAASGTGRLLAVGHAFGGQLLYGHLALGGGGLAAAVTLSAAVHFDRPRTEVRLATLAAQLLPAGAALPLRAMHAVLAPSSRPGPASLVGEAVDGPVLRSLLLNGSEDVGVGLVRQVGTWLRAGVLCDRHDRIDYLAALRGHRLPLLVVAAEGDGLCRPHQARPAVEAWAPGAAHWWLLDGRWGHLDPLLGRDAGEHVHTELLRWLEPHREACWRADWP